MIYRNNSFVLRKINNTFLLITTKCPLHGKWMFVLNKMGSIVWESIKDGVEKKELIQCISNEMLNGISNEEEDILYEFIQKLVKLGLLEEK